MTVQPGVTGISVRVVPCGIEDQGRSISPKAQRTRARDDGDTVHKVESGASQSDERKSSLKSWLDESVYIIIVPQLIAAVHALGFVVASTATDNPVLAGLGDKQIQPATRACRLVSTAVVCCSDGCGYPTTCEISLCEAARCEPQS